MRSILHAFPLCAAFAPLLVTACSLGRAPLCAATEGSDATGQSAIAWEAVRGPPGIRGRVVAVRSEAPLSGAQVFLRHAPRRAFTDSLGMVTLAYANGEDTLEVLAMGHYPSSARIILPRDSTVVFRATMARVPPQIDYGIACPP